MKGKAMSRYAKIYISVVAVFAVLLIIACVVLWSLLDAYEKTRPKHVAEEVFNDYFVSGDIGSMMENYLPEKLKFETKESINRGFAENYDPSKLAFFSVATSTDKSEQYAVSYDDRRIAYYTLSPTDKKAGFGFEYYKLSDAEFFFADSADINVMVQKGQKLMINGVEVPDEYITEADIKSASYQYMPNGVTGIMYDKYTVSGLLFDPVVAIVSADGVELPVVFNEAEQCSYAQTVYNEKLAAEQSGYVIKAVTEYTKYMSNDASFGAVATYLDRDSAIYDRVRSVTVTWVRDHSGYRIFDEKATEFYEYSDGVFSCRVTMTETLSRPGYSDYVEHVDVTLYLRRVNEKYLIYEIVNN